jgi:sulfonate transport system substrate-binding protein
MNAQVNKVRIVNAGGLFVLAVMSRKGFLERRLSPIGKTVAWSPQLDTGPEITDLFWRGKLDIAACCELPIFKAVSDGMSLKIIGTTGRNLGRIIMGPKNSEVESPNDLKGKRFGYVKGGGAQTVLARWLEKVGLKENDLTLVNVHPSKGVAMLESGEIAAWSTWSPYREILEVRGTGRLLFDMSHVKAHALDLVVREEFARKNPEVLREFLSAYLDTIEWIESHVEESKGILMEVMGVERRVIDLVWEHRPTYDPTITPDVLEDLEEGLRLAKSQGEVRPEVALLEMVDTSFMERVAEFSTAVA